MMEWHITIEAREEGVGKGCDPWPIGGVGAPCTTLLMAWV